MSKAAVQALKLAQSYYAARFSRLAADKVAAGLKETETALKQQLMDTLEANNINAVGDKQHIYALVQSMEPTVEDWGKFYTHIRRTGEFELLFRRINPASVKERWELNQKVPGVGKFPTVALSVTKSKGAGK